MAGARRIEGGQRANDGPSFPVEEPVLDGHDIQGNIVPGFMKPYMAVAALSFPDAPRAKAWLKEVVGDLTTLARAMESRVKVRRHRTFTPALVDRVGAIPDEVDDAFLNLGLSHQALKTLAAGHHKREKEVEQFEDEAFEAGLAARSAALGDPTDPSKEGYRGNWVFGGPGKEADALLVFGADRHEEVVRLVGSTLATATSLGLEVLYQEEGAKLDEIGHEHFGFQDGVSQPGVRGRHTADPDGYLTPRTIAASAIPETWTYGLPGQYLVWPGEFVFGYEGQGVDPLLPGAVNIPGPAWSRNGSYLTFRRLRQDVEAFWRFVTATAGELAKQEGFEDMTATALAARIVGRWPSGAPVSRVPDGDVVELGLDRLANNHFGFASDTEPLALAEGGTTNGFPEAKSDPIGLTCPQAAHIRKVNTRDLPNDQGGRRASFNRRILRRALPFGPKLEDPLGSKADPADGNRGLLFISYQSSIVDQFEFLNSAWMGDPKAPRDPSGHDLLVGQNGQPEEDRVRSCLVFGSGAQTAEISTAGWDPGEWVIPTGGGYFFSPSLSAIRDVLSE